MDGHHFISPATIADASSFPRLETLCLRGLNENTGETLPAALTVASSHLRTLRRMEIHAAAGVVLGALAVLPRDAFLTVTSFQCGVSPSEADVLGIELSAVLSALAAAMPNLRSLTTPLIATDIWCTRWNDSRVFKRTAETSPAKRVHVDMTARAATRAMGSGDGDPLFPRLRRLTVLCLSLGTLAVLPDLLSSPLVSLRIETAADSYSPSDLASLVHSLSLRQPSCLARLEVFASNKCSSARHLPYMYPVMAVQHLVTLMQRLPPTVHDLSLPVAVSRWDDQQALLQILPRFSRLAVAVAPQDLALGTSYVAVEETDDGILLLDSSEMKVFSGCWMSRLYLTYLQQHVPWCALELLLLENN